MGARKGDDTNIKKNREKTQFSGQRAVEAGKKGQKASVAARRKKKELRERLVLAMECPVEGDSARKIAKAIGVMPEEATNYDLIIARLLLTAAKGDIRAIQMIFEYMSETPAEKRAESEEKRREELFRMEVDKIKNLDKDNDAVLEYIDAMKHNIKKPDDDNTETQ